MTSQDYYRALAAKDARFDGVFFAGIKSTGIYCRPICRVKTPRQASCVFFSSQAAAEAAGFRPCLRCRPELAPYDLQQNLAHAIWHKIAAGALNGHSVETLAKHVGLSSRQLRRVMLNEFGLSPIEMAQTQRLLFAKKLIQETALSMTDIAFSAGFGSVRRFNALFEERYQLKPASIRRAAISNEANANIQLRLAYRPPYAWETLLAYLRGRAMKGVESVDLQQGCYRRSIRVGGKQGWIAVSHLEQKQQLLLEIAPSLAAVLLPLLATIRQQFDVEANPLVIAAHLQSDPLLAKQIEQTPGLRVPGCFSSFELAIRAILGQQVSVAGATTVAGRLVEQFGEPIETPWATVTHHFPTAAQIASLEINQIAGIGIPTKRAETISAFAKFALDGGLQSSVNISLEQQVQKLKTLPGIGEWTAQYIAMRGLRYPNAFPAGDLGLRKAVSESAGMLCSEKALLERAQAWSPWRSYAALLLWQSLSS
ncbi:DNA-3-methyladenine glycosylase 2 family protein [Undibacterium sp. FT137W]|uniref:DNA-3-methyladenine glycosylase II n=2 Tax=Undibacterium fentianense TaxID=2828728 RepID=A0A941IFE3_9BURK|nr:DNA-3-methyladenine glycosylase 2 family protein [Undibacterium fentianense]